MTVLCQVENKPIVKADKMTFTRIGKLVMRENRRVYDLKTGRWIYKK